MTRPLCFILRHGETDWNLEGRLQGSSDIPLNDEGRRQAAADLKDWMEENGADAADSDSADLTAALAASDLVVTATSAAEPLFDDAAIRAMILGT